MGDFADLNSHGWVTLRKRGEHGQRLKVQQEATDYPPPGQGTSGRHDSERNGEGERWGVGMTRMMEKGRNRKPMLCIRILID